VGSITEEGGEDPREVLVSDLQRSSVTNQHSWIASEWSPSRCLHSVREVPRWRQKAYGGRRGSICCTSEQVEGQQPQRQK
jgi:hypothetical protein